MTGYSGHFYFMQIRQFPTFFDSWCCVNNGMTV
jgi:hypothetical protein